MSGRLILAVVLFAAALLIVSWSLGRRTDHVDNTTAALYTRNAKLCEVLYRLVARSGATVGKAGTPGYAYYKQHPEELKLARQQNRQFLRELPCRKEQHER